MIQKSSCGALLIRQADQRSNSEAIDGVEVVATAAASAAATWPQAERLSPQSLGGKAAPPPRMTILSCIPAAVAALLGFDASFLVSRTACRRAASVWAFASERKISAGARPHFITPDRSNADPLAVLQIGFTSDGCDGHRARRACYVFLLMGRPVSTTSEWIINSLGVGVMVTKQLSIAISICIGSGIAFETFAGAPASPTRIDFDQVFADVTRQSAGYVDRAHKSDRLPNFKPVLAEPALLPYCEPLASEFADPVLGRIVGRCDA